MIKEVHLANETIAGFSNWLRQEFQQPNYAPYELHMTPNGLGKRFSIKANEEKIAEIDVQPVGKQLRVRTERLKFETDDNKIVQEGFLEFYYEAMARDYKELPDDVSPLDRFIDWSIDDLYPHDNLPASLPEHLNTAVSHSTLTQTATETSHNLVSLADKMHKLFDDSEIHDLCFRLNEKYDDLRGERLQNKIQDLVERLNRQGRIPELLRLLRELRSKENWK
jgi:hypothetical protein